MSETYEGRAKQSNVTDESGDTINMDDANCCGDPFDRGRVDYESLAKRLENDDSLWVGH